MGSRFSLFKNEDVDMSPVLRKRNEYVDIDTMSAAAVKKELKQHGIEVDALLRDKLKELRQAEVSAVARRSGTTPMGTLSNDTFFSDLFCLKRRKRRRLLFSRPPFRSLLSDQKQTDRSRVRNCPVRILRCDLLRTVCGR